MKKHIARIIREKLNIKRIDPRRFYLVNDGAYRWIGDRANLSAATARELCAIDRCGTRPDLASAEEQAMAESSDYNTICAGVACLSAQHGAAGWVAWDALPEQWRDGTALGPIAPL